MCGSRTGLSLPLLLAGATQAGCDGGAAGVIQLDSLDNTVNGAFPPLGSLLAGLGDPPLLGRARRLADSLRQVLIAGDGNVLCRTRLKLDGRRSEVRTEETSVGNLTARSVDISLENGGGSLPEAGGAANRHRAPQ